MKTKPQKVDPLRSCSFGDRRQRRRKEKKVVKNALHFLFLWNNPRFRKNVLETLRYGAPRCFWFTGFLYTTIFPLRTCKLLFSLRVKSLFSRYLKDFSKADENLFLEAFISFIWMVYWATREYRKIRCKMSFFNQKWRDSFHIPGKHEKTTIRILISRIQEGKHFAFSLHINKHAFYQTVN